MSDDTLKLLIEGLLRGLKQTIKTLESVLDHIKNHAVVTGYIPLEKMESSGKKRCQLEKKP